MSQSPEERGGLPTLCYAAYRLSPGLNPLKNGAVFRLEERAANPLYADVSIP